MPLCTQADMEKLGQVDFTNTPEDAVTLYIAVAQAAIESHVGRQLDQASVSGETLDGGWRKRIVRLARTPVKSITAVTEDGEALTEGDDYLSYADGRLHRILGASTLEDWYWTRKRRAIVVDYIGGYSDADPGYEVPDDLRWVCASVALRLFKTEAAWAQSPAGVTGAAKSVTLEGVGAVSYGGPGGPAGVLAGVGGQAEQGSQPALTPQERRALSKYVRRMES